MSKKYKFRTDYEKLCPGVEINPEVLLLLKKSDRRMEYFERDLKRGRYVRDKKGKAVRDKNGQLIDLPEREVSMEKLIGESWEFFSDDLTPEENVINTENADIFELHRCMTLLTEEECDLITALYFHKMTIRGYADSKGMSKSRVDRLHQKILVLLRKSFRR